MLNMIFIITLIFTLISQAKTQTSFPIIPIKSSPTLPPTPSNKLINIPIPQNESLDIKDLVLKEINNYRISKGLLVLKEDPFTCGFAKLRAEEISANFNHDGFTNRINDKTLPYPTYSVISENMAMNSNFEEVVKMWINSSGHSANLQKDTPFACVGIFNEYFIFESWKP